METIVNLSFKERMQLKQAADRKVGGKKFIHSPINHLLKEIEVINDAENQRRLYITPDGKRYPSITTVLSVLKAPELEEWIRTTDPSVVKEVSSRAALRGSIVHELVEHYINNELSEFDSSTRPSDIKSFKQLQPILDEHVDNILIQEAPLYSNKWRIAGRVDCIGDYDKIESIIDFKTSRRIKSKEDIPNYFIQMTAYAEMLEELTGISIDQIVIIMEVENDQPIVFKESRSNWIDSLRDTRKRYYEQYGI